MKAIILNQALWRRWSVRNIFCGAACSSRWQCKSRTCRWTSTDYRMRKARNSQAKPINQAKETDFINQPSEAKGFRQSDQAKRSFFALLDCWTHLAARWTRGNLLFSAELHSFGTLLQCALASEQGPELAIDHRFLASSLCMGFLTCRRSLAGLRQSLHSQVLTLSRPIPSFILVHIVSAPLSGFLMLQRSSCDLSTEQISKTNSPSPKDLPQ
jgi:hypothetical protein